MKAWAGNGAGSRQHALDRSAACGARSLSELYGRSGYAGYSLTFPNGAVVDLAGLGVRGPGSSIFSDVTLISRNGCAINLFNLIQRTDGGAGLWAGLRAQAMGEARRRGYEIENREGELGERSELRIFTESGAYRGFWYAIEAGNVLYVLRIFSDQIQISPVLETLLREKLALAAE